MGKLKDILIDIEEALLEGVKTPTEISESLRVPLEWVHDVSDNLAGEISPQRADAP